MTDLNAPRFSVLAVEDEHCDYSFILCNSEWEGLLVSDTREALDSVCAILNADPTVSVADAFAQSCAERGRLCFWQGDENSGRYFENDYYDGFAAFARGEALVDGLSEEFQSGWNEAAADACAAAIDSVETREMIADCTMIAIERACTMRRRFTPYA